MSNRKGNFVKVNATYIGNDLLNKLANEVCPVLVASMEERLRQCIRPVSRWYGTRYVPDYTKMNQVISETRFIGYSDWDDVIYTDLTKDGMIVSAILDMLAVGRTLYLTPEYARVYHMYFDDIQQVLHS